MPPAQCAERAMIIPVFNGEAHLDATLRAIMASGLVRRPYEIIVVDDGSGDRTAAVASAWSARHAQVRLIRLPGHRGKGAAVRAGMLAASAAHRCFIDADMPMPVAQVEFMFDRLDHGAQVVIASRALPGSQLGWADPVRRLLSRVFNRVVRALFRLPFRDTQCGFKGLSAEASEAIFSRAQVDGFAFDVELLLLAKQLGYPVEEMPVRWANPAASTVRITSHAPRIARDLWRLKRDFRGAARRDASAPGHRERLTAAILTKNEESRIARCLESVGWADDLVVVDGLSTDRTVEIAQRFGARVVSHQFEGSFAAERNLGMAHATGDWVLHLDADDIVTPEFRATIEQVLAEPPAHAALKFRRKSYLLGRWMRHGGWHHYLPNLVRREAVRYEGRVHERPVIRGTIGTLDADVEHHPCEDLRSFLDRHNRYTSLSAAEVAAREGRLEPGEVNRRLVRKPWKTFWKTYVKKQGFREGMHGLVFALFYAGVEMLVWAKYGASDPEAVARQVEQINEQSSLDAAALRRSQPRVPGITVAYRLAIKPLSQCWAARHSDAFVQPALAAWTQFLTWAKYWELGLPSRSS